MDMDFAVSCPLVRHWRLVSGFCPSTRTFDPCFFQTPPRGGSPCIITRPSPPSGWPEDFHLQTAEHAQHTTTPLARTLVLKASCPPWAAPSGTGGEQPSRTATLAGLRLSGPVGIHIPVLSKLNGRGRRNRTPIPKERRYSRPVADHPPAPAVEHRVRIELTMSCFAGSRFAN